VTELNSARILRELIISLGHDPDLINKTRLQEVADRLGEVAGHSGWGYKYLDNILRGRLDASKKLTDAILRLGALLDGSIQAEYHRVNVLSQHDIPPDTLILSEARRCIGCGAWFIPRSGNQMRHTRNCGKKSGK
jgi:hypothetical protein